MEAMYPEFQEAFRGSPEYIAGILKDYLPDILALDRQGPLVDLGSGRGEWLEILRNAGVEAYGVDTSEDFAKQCQERGLKVVLADACEHLATLPERSLSAVTAFHLVEHLPIEGVIRLIDLALRALHSGGVLIFETPNPENLVVGASSFYLDPSHVRPLPPGLLAFLLEARGLSEVETRYLHPNDAGNLGSPLQVAPWADDVAPLVQEINSRFFGPQDYAVIGRRV
jgi:O-antigen chain-terminating methyltransferase